MKIRPHFSLTRFAVIGLVGFVAASLLHLATNSVASAVLARAAFGTIAPVMRTLAVLYLVEAFSPRRPVVGLLLGFCSLQLGLPFSRVISTTLLEAGCRGHAYTP